MQSPFILDVTAATLEMDVVEASKHVPVIADFVAYVASPGASFITGASLAVDGGYSA